MIASVEVRGLALVRGGRTLFQNLDLDLKAGEAVALTGPNGSGKTSLLRAIAGLIRPASGAIRFRGADGPLDADEARGGWLHLIGHLDGLKGSRLAAEELAFQARWTGAGEGDIRAAMAAMELKPLAGLEVRMLSAGQRRRLALARLIASPRPLWLLDEPMAPLDAGRRAAFGAVMARHLRCGGIILAAVHDPLPLPARGVELLA